VRLVNVTDGDETPPVATAVQIVVTVSRIDGRVEDHAFGGADDDRWVTLSTATTTLDVLAVPGGGFVSLFVTRLPAGGLESLRLFVSAAGPNFVTTADGVRHPLVVPSGAVDVVGDFDVENCGTGFVTLAFWGKKSILVQPSGDGTGWFLRPVIRVREAVVTGVKCDDEQDEQGDRGPRSH
jgi:hypothetical protein